MGHEHFPGGEAQGGSKGKAFNVADTTAGGKDERTPLQIASDLSQPPKKGTAPKENIVVAGKAEDEERLREFLGTEDQCVKRAPAEIRLQLNLPPDASSEEVYHGMAREFVKAFKNATPALQNEGLKNLGISRDQAGDANTVFEAMVRSDKARFGLTGPTDFNKLETAKHRYDYHHMEVDYD